MVCWQRQIEIMMDCQEEYIHVDVSWDLLSVTRYLGTFDLVRMVKVGWIQIYEHWKESKDEWIYFSRIYTMTSGPTKIFF
jgi:hypothetical protein